ncbi:Pentatricopeptide repeat-containing protein 2, mitochondrial [Elsinoe australis]|uniref:Pentatricopeptide repeat-containing protein 2, mitochondrial n=1 Tax=Elsinoe australis TaxID=40998 RepID=A0A2P8A873_9PEZI|nr:Pentatricopeptide repeat-containing protein 2, mitochondrial [Elsinoe australis]
MLRDLVEAALNQVLLSGAIPNAQVNSTLAFWRDRWTSDILPKNLPPIGGPSGISPLAPAARFAESLGSNNYRDNLLPVAASINAVKGRIFNRRAPTAVDRFEDLVDSAATLAVFNYLNDPELGREQFLNTRQRVRTQTRLIESNMPDAGRLLAFFDKFWEDYLTTIENEAETWLIEQIGYARELFEEIRDPNGNRPDSYRFVMDTLDDMQRQIDEGAARFPRGQ